MKSQCKYQCDIYDVKPHKLVLGKWIHYLRDYPDRELCEFVFSCIQHGIPMCYEGNPLRLPGVEKNLFTTPQQDIAITKYVVSQCELGYISGPFRRKPKNLLINAVGAVPKDKTKHRVITHLSHPEGYSVNDGITRELVSVNYVGVYDVVVMLLDAGPRAWLWKSDFAGAYRQLLVQLCDRLLMGFKWCGYYFIDNRLNFGSRTGPCIFSLFATLIIWIVIRKYKDSTLFKFILSYMDDTFAACTTKLSANREMLAYKKLCMELGVELSEKKTVGPSQSLKILGLQYNTVDQTVTMGSDRRKKVYATLVSLLKVKVITTKELQSITGTLQYIVTVIWCGPAFLNRLYKKSGHYPSAPVKLNDKYVIQDIHFWICMVSIDYAIPFNWIVFDQNTADIIVYTDAASTEGGGIVINEKWCWIKTWKNIFKNLKTNINFLELYMVVVTIATFAENWSGRRVKFIVDNMPAVEIINARSARSPLMLNLIQIIGLYAIRYRFFLTSDYINTKENTLADTISRNKVSKTWLLVNGLEPTPTPYILPSLEFEQHLKPLGFPSLKELLRNS